MTELSVAQVAERAGAGSELVGECLRLGLLPGEQFGPRSVERVRLVHLLAQRGITPEVVAGVESAHPGMLEHFVEMLYPTADWPTTRLDDAAAELGVDIDMARTMWETAGRAEQGDWLTAEDVEGLRSLATALTAGFPPDALLQMVRVYADALGRVAEAEARLFHFYVHEQLRAPGTDFGQVIEDTEATRVELESLTEPAILYFHRRGMVKAVREDVVLHMGEEAGITAPSTITGQMPVAVLFIDLASFTSLTEAMGDTSASQVLDRFSDLVRRAANRCGGRVVKQIGDAFMVVFSDAASAVRCACEIGRASAEEPQFPGTRMGLHAGPVLYREGDYYGATVNLAARVTGEAGRDQLLVTQPVRDAAVDLDGLEFVAAGRRELKGISEPVDLFDVRPYEQSAQRQIDPVCGMTLSPADVAATLSVEGHDHVFCSESCLRRFEANPRRYANDA